MKSTRTFLHFIALVGIASIFLSNSTGRPGNWAGAPGDNGTCGTCHTSAGTGSINLTGVPAAYVPGQTYSLTLVLNQAVQPVGGFQLVATNGTTNAQVGTFSTTPGETKLISNRLVQSASKAFNSGSVSWTTNWTAPAIGTAPADVVFHYSGNAANGNGGNGAGDFAFTSSSATVLPVELLSFEAETTKENHVFISWETTNEQNHDFFSIERSTDSRTFETIGKVQEISSVYNEINTYDFTDADLPQSENVYYRLKQVDLDGAFAYSAVRHLRMKNDVVSVFPNPVVAGNDISVKFTAERAGEKNINLFNVEGKLIFSQVNGVEKGQNVLRISDVSLDKGIYFLSLEGVAGMQRIIVQ